MAFLRWLIIGVVTGLEQESKKEWEWDNDECEDHLTEREGVLHEPANYYPGE